MSAYLCVALAAVCTDVAAGNDIVVISGATMGTTYAVKIGEHDRVDADALHSAIDARLERINDQMSTWRPDSELSRFNASRGAEWFPVSTDTVDVVQAAHAVSVLSGGAFDVTVGAMVNLWGFGPGGGDKGLPSEQAIATAKRGVDYRSLEARASPPALRKRYADTYVDLSGIAKGFAVDAVARLLDARQIRSYLVEIGGELRGSGVKPDGSPWKVAIETPSPGARSVQSIVALRDAAVATSGDYRNYREQDGRRYSHTIDPRTGRPIAHALASVSVIAPSAMRADALATAIMVMGPEKGMRMAEGEALAVQLIVRTHDGFRVLTTASFENYLLR